MKIIDDGYTADEVARAFKKLGEAASAVPLLDLDEIKKMRLKLMKIRYGTWRFLMPEYYKWLLFCS